MMVISIRNLVKRYDKLLAVDHLNLDVEEGDIYGIIGPNGSGKTTILRCILGLESFEKGNIKVLDSLVFEADRMKKALIGVVFQESAVFPALTVYENIYYFTSLYLKDSEEIKKAATAAMECMKLTDYSASYPSKLSGGILRRLNFACSIAHRPKLLIVDETSAAIDSQSRKVVEEAIVKMHEDGTTILYITQYYEEVERLCNKIAIMDKGKLVTTGTLDEIKAKVALGEIIKIRVYSLKGKDLSQISNIKNVAYVDYKNEILQIKTRMGKENLLHILNYLMEQKISFGEVSLEVPTLNDIFLELTNENT